MSRNVCPFQLGAEEAHAQAAWKPYDVLFDDEYDIPFCARDR